MVTGDKQQFQKAEDTLGRFFLRARRIAAHSLAVDPSELEALANPKLSGTLRNDGSIEIRRRLPDEEIFESLASRLRPLLLKTESIHYAKVLEAIETVIKGVNKHQPIRMRFLENMPAYVTTGANSTKQGR